MIMYCPQCGHELPRILKIGITSCSNCCTVFDSCKWNQVLSLSWAVRKQHISDPDMLIEQFGADRDDAEFVVEYVFEECCNHQEFVKLLKTSPFLKIRQSDVA